MKPKKFTYQLHQGRKQFKIPLTTCKRMVSESETARAHCYPKPGEGYAVAVLTASGTIYTGASYTSETQSLTMHAEAVALAHASQHGETNIIAITGPNCHICKQLIWESSLNSHIEILVIISENGEPKQIPISSLMPYPWPNIQGKK